MTSKSTRWRTREFSSNPEVTSSSTESVKAEISTSAPINSFRNGDQSHHSIVGVCVDSILRLPPLPYGHHIQARTRRHPNESRPAGNSNHAAPSFRPRQPENSSGYAASRSISSLLHSPTAPISLPTNASGASPQASSRATWSSVPASESTI